MIQIKHKITWAILWEGETLSNANLHNANLHNADLRNADLSYANLRYANLRYANLRYANLRNADLSYANLRYADLSYADLSNADLSNANLRYANLSNADLSNANLRYANLSNAKDGDLLVKNIFSIGPLGSRSSHLQIWQYQDLSLTYKTGCFSGTEQEFKAQIEKTHQNNEYSLQYHGVIALMAILNK